MSNSEKDKSGDSLRYNDFDINDFRAFVGKFEAYHGIDLAEVWRQTQSPEGLRLYLEKTLAEISIKIDSLRQHPTPEVVRAAGYLAPAGMLFTLLNEIQALAWLSEPATIRERAKEALRIANPGMAEALIEALAEERINTWRVDLCTISKAEIDRLIKPLRDDSLSNSMQTIDTGIVGDMDAQIAMHLAGLTEVNEDLNYFFSRRMTEKAEINGKTSMDAYEMAGALGSTPGLGIDASSLRRGEDVTKAANYKISRLPLAWIAVIAKLKTEIRLAHMATITKKLSD